MLQSPHGLDATRLIIVLLGRRWCQMSEERRGDTDMLGILDGYGGGGAVAEEVRIDGSAETVTGAALDTVVNRLPVHR